MIQAYLNPELDYIHVTSLNIFITLAVLLVLNLIILVTWTVLEPQEWTRIERDATDVFNRHVESYGTCKGDASLPFVVVLVVLDFLFLILGNWWAYQSRNIETEYLESRYIGISQAAVLQAWCMGIPILIVVWDTPQAKFFVETGIIFVTSLAFLLLIYVPKVVASIVDRRSAIAEEKRKAYSSFIENKAKRENDFDDDQPREGVPSSSSSSNSSHDKNSTDPVTADKDASTGELNGTGSGNILNSENPGRARVGFGAGQKVDERPAVVSGLKVVHNPRVSTFMWTE